MISPPYVVVVHQVTAQVEAIACAHCAGHSIRSGVVGIVVQTFQVDVGAIRQTAAIRRFAVSPQRRGCTVILGAIVGNVLLLEGHATTYAAKILGHIKMITTAF